jgi:beta propeller repeat protein
LRASSGHQWCPKIFGNYVIWDDYRSGTWGDVYLFNLTSGTETLVINSSIRGFKCPEIYENKLVYEEYGDIVIYDFVNGTSKILAFTGDQQHPNIYKSKAVWVDIPTNSIKVYDIDSEQIIKTISSSGGIEEPAIFENDIVWRQNSNTIFHYNLQTGVTNQITSNTSEKGAPSIFGNLIVWHDKRNGAPDVYMYNLDSQQETNIANTLNTETYPVIYGNRVLYGSLDNIYLYEVLTGVTGLSAW